MYEAVWTNQISPFVHVLPQNTKKHTSHILIPILEGLDRISIFYDFAQTIPRTYAVII
jgi:hypothetical protein